MKKAGIIKDENGFIKFFFVTLILVVCIYVGIKFAMPYYRYSAFKSDAKELARVSIGDTERTKEQLLGRAQELNLPLRGNDIQVIKLEKTVRVRTSWSEIVDILGLYQRKLNFSVDVEG